MFVMSYNVLLYTVSALVFRSRLIPLYSVITYAVGIKAVDFVVEGLDKAKAVYIVTGQSTELQQKLAEQLGRGVTVFNAEGGYSSEEKKMVFCVVNRFEVGRAKRIVEENDPEAFVTVTDVSETMGGRKISFSIRRK